MAKYSKEEKETIEKVKAYLKNIRALKIEKLSLELEYNDIPTPQSPKIGNELPGGYVKPKDQQYDSYIIKRELLLKRINIFGEELDKFIPVLYLLKKGHRNIIQCYISTRSYNEMIDMLYNDHCISESTYNRTIPEICLELAKHLDYKRPVTIAELNTRFGESIRNESKMKGK